MSDTPKLQEGTELRNYRIKKLIGRGGFGEVYEAENINVRQPVAIKVYRIDDTNALAAFQRGANCLIQLKHPNIVTLYDFFVQDGFAVSVMELLDPHATGRRLVGSFRGKRGVNEFLELLLPLVQALRYSHNATFVDTENKSRVGVFHGDIKPDNVLMTEGRPKLSDFMIPNLEAFLSKSKGGEGFPGYDTAQFGTPMYMSLEQLGGNVSEQTDIFNLGITGFELLTGFYPFETKLDFLFDRPQKPERFNPSCPDWLSQLLLRCICKETDARYQHASEIERELLQYTDEDASLTASRIATNSEGQTDSGEPSRSGPGSLWSEGMFFIVLLVVVIASVVAVTTVLPGPLIPVGLIAVLLLFVIVAVFILRQQRNLSEAGFLSIVRRVLGKMKLLKRE